MILFFFIALSIICAGLVIYNRTNQVTPTTSDDFKKFQLTYVSVYLIMSASDWMQGPYVYALYESYGFSIKDIGLLFIAGFGSSMIFGTFVGSLSDKFGRKLSCMIYVVLYIISCATKHSGSFFVLMLGRLTGGIATSILFSAFESWMVSEHFKRGYSEEWLGHTFYLQVFGNGIIAILSGLVASQVKSFFGTMTAPFDTAIVLLVIGGVIIFYTWTENYGNSSVDVKQSFVEGFSTLTNDFKVAALGLAQSMFESAMYIFVFMWTPTLDRSISNLNHGLVFACFMVAVMIGSSLFSLLGAKQVKKEKMLLIVFATAALTFVIPILAPDNGFVLMIGFLVYEACVGMFWPCMGTLKGMYIPENVRSTVMNYFRVPTNLFVVLTLNRVSQMERNTVFLICVGLASVSAIAQYALLHVLENKEKIDTSNDVEAAVPLVSQE